MQWCVRHDGNIKWANLSTINHCIATQNYIMTKSNIIRIVIVAIRIISYENK